MYLPVQTGPGGLWTLYDFGRKRVSSAAADSFRQAIAHVGTVPQDELWLIDLVRTKSNEDDATATSRAYICLDAPEFDVSGTMTGSYDVADQNSPIHAPGGSEVLVVWEDIEPGRVGDAYVQWSVMKGAVS